MLLASAHLAKMHIRRAKSLEHSIDEHILPALESTPVGIRFRKYVTPQCSQGEGASCRTHQGRIEDQNRHATLQNTYQYICARDYQTDENNIIAASS